MIHPLTTAEIHAALADLTEDDMARARASLARDAARREQAVTTPAVPPGHPGRDQKGPTMDPIVTDLRRELEKAREALTATHKHLTAHAEMNAALHLATSVMYSPLHAKVVAAITGIGHALDRTEQHVPTLDSRSMDGEWAALVADLDRCEHGRHQGDDCGSCGGTSTGNPHLRPNHVIGYGVHGDPIVMPDRVHKYDPAAWRRPDVLDGGAAR